MKVLETERLILRSWEEGDVVPYFEMNQDPLVIEYARAVRTLEEVREFTERCNRSIEERKFGVFAVELKGTGEFIGFIGLNEPRFEAHFMPAVEVAWRLGSKYWGKGYATEGARACLEYGFKVLGLKKIVAFTVPDNVRSIRVMEKIGMKRDEGGDFEHPEIERGNRLSKHVLYFSE